MTLVSGASSLRRFQVLGDGLIFIHADALGVGPDVGLVEDAAGQKIELLFLQRKSADGVRFSLWP